MKICSQHKSSLAKAQYCFLELFKDEIETGEILTGEFNVYGRAPKGVNIQMKKLNGTKIEYLKRFLSDKYESGKNLNVI